MTFFNDTKEHSAVDHLKIVMNKKKKGSQASLSASQSNKLFIVVLTNSIH